MKKEWLDLKNLNSTEITTSMLLGTFNHFKDARGKIHNLSKSQILQPIKQGVYIINSEFGERPYSKEILANLIYGPSYISLQTALSAYGFIPEQVSTTFSVCFGRGKSFSTPVGEFEFLHIKKEIYPLGVQLKEVYKNAFCLYATPEKALLDFLYLKEKKAEFKKQKEYFEYLVDSYRFDLQAIEDQISIKKLQDFADQYRHVHIQWFVNELAKRLLK